MQSRIASAYDGLGEANRSSHIYEGLSAINAKLVDDQPVKPVDIERFVALAHRQPPFHYEFRHLDPGKMSQIVSQGTRHCLVVRVTVDL